MAADDVPVPFSYPQALGTAMDAVTSRVGFSRFKVGGPLLSILEAAAQADVRSNQAVFNALQASDINNSRGVLLDRIGGDEKLPRRKLNKATGTITITDSSFTKIASKIFQGTAAPIVGSTTIYVEDASQMGTSGYVYLGRNTTSLEGPLQFTATTNLGNYWSITLASATTRFHNRGESVILAQGGSRNIGAGTVVATPVGALNSAVQFVTTYPYTIPDGETELLNVAVVCSVPGIVGNVPAGAITTFTGSPPFTGAVVTNPSPFIDGRDVEKDDAYRERIKKYRNSRPRGTDLAIEQAVIGAISPDENKTVQSANLIRVSGKPSKLIIDDGSGYEPTWQGVGIEVLVDSASGGEEVVSTINRPVQKAVLVSANESPFYLLDQAALSVEVGGIVSTHSFDLDEFSSSSPSAYEIIAQVNANTDLTWGMTTSGAGSFLVIFAKTEENEDLRVIPQTSATDANDYFLFPTTRTYTTLLYRNDRLLSKDGDYARVASEPFGSWNAFSGSQTLQVSIDFVETFTATIVDQDFIDAGTGYSGVGKNDLDSWVLVLERVLPGITPSVVGDQIYLTSNKGRDSDAYVEILGGTLVNENVFTTGTMSRGKDRDYTLDRGTGQITLMDVLAASDRLTLGSLWTRGFTETSAISPINVSADRKAWFFVDGNSTVQTHGVSPGTPLTAAIVSPQHYGFKASITATASSDVFAKVNIGDWMTIWSTDADLPPALQRTWKVSDTVENGGFINEVVFEKPGAGFARMGMGYTVLQPAGVSLSKVLVCGGYVRDTGGNTGRTGSGILNSVETFDPNTGEWAQIARMNIPRAFHSCTLLDNGKVFVTGGFDATGAAVNTTEIYDPNTNAWTYGPVMSTVRAKHSATLLVSNNVLICGGVSAVEGGSVTDTTQEYDRTSNTFVHASTMGTTRYGHRAVLMPSASAKPDDVLIIGGINNAGTELLTCEVYSDLGFTFSSTGSMARARSFHGAAVAETNEVIAIGGNGKVSTSDSTFERYNITTGTWSLDAINAVDFYTFHHKNVAVSVTDGKIIAPFCRKSAVSDASIVSLQYNTSTHTWDAIATSFVGGTEVIDCVSVGLTGPASVDKVFFSHGVVLSSFYESGVGASGITMSTHGIYDVDTATWSYPDLITGLSSDQLTDKGITFVTSESYPQEVTIPTGNAYVAGTFAGYINEAEGLTADVYRTSRLRVSTNSYDNDGDLVLAGYTGTELDLPIGTVYSNETGHMASVEAGNSALGTPFGFNVYRIGGYQASSLDDLVDDVVLGTIYGPIPASGSLVGLKAGTTGYRPDDYTSASLFANFGQSQGYRADIGKAEFLDEISGGYAIGLRKAIYPTSNTPVIFTSPYAIGPEDTLSVQVDGDPETKQFVIPFYRECTPSNSTYGSTIYLKDDVNGGTLFQNTFGADYNFNDFAVFMHARGKSHSGTASKRILWRYYRMGPEGNHVLIRYVLPTEASAAVSVSTTYQEDFTDVQANTRKNVVNIHLNSGAAKEASTIRTTSKLGLARSGIGANSYIFAVLGFTVSQSQRSSLNGHTRLRCSVPYISSPGDGPQGTGIQVGDILYFNAAVPNISTLISGSFTVDQVDAFNVGGGYQDIYVTPGDLDNGTVYGPAANPGTVSFDQAGETSWDGTTVAGDYFYLDSPWDNHYSERTARVLVYSARHLQLAQPDVYGDGDEDIAWSEIADPDSIKIFGKSTSTAAQIVTAVNALAAVTDSTCPITGTVTGTGLGVIDRATWEELVSMNGGYSLADGINYVQSTIEPPLSTDQTGFLLKNTVTSDLTTNNDWANEEVKLVPVTLASCLRWLNTLCVTGLSTAAEITDSANGTKLQIASLTPGTGGSVQVLGGNASLATGTVYGAGVLVDRNSTDDNFYATITAGESMGFVGGNWVSIDNTTSVAKNAFWMDAGYTASVTSAGLWTFDDVAPFTIKDSVGSLICSFEKVGDYVAINIPKKINGDGSGPNDIQLLEQGYIYIYSPDAELDFYVVSAANKGVYKILQVGETEDFKTIWIKNSAVVEQDTVIKAVILTADSVVPGDIWSVNTTVWGVNNKRDWVVTEVGSATVGGEMFTGINSFRTDVSLNTPTAIASVEFGTTTAGQFIEGTPTKLIKEVFSVIPNENGAYADIFFTNEVGYEKVTESAGSVITALDKFAFPSGTALGVNGYRYNDGLIGEANKIVYGDKNDTATYPGYAAAGANILTDAAMVRRLKISLGLRVESGLQGEDIAARVKSEVAAFVNQQSASFAVEGILRAAASVGGVKAPSIIYPAFSSVNDLIVVNPGEVPKIQDLDNDIEIIFIGE